MSNTVSSRVAVWLILLMACVTLIAQTRSLAVFPIANATRWYSDESWVMSESKAQIEHGVVSYPDARASSIATSKGLLLGTTWLSALLYGLPAALAPTGSDIVLIGRIVSLVLTLVTFVAIFFFMRRLGAPDYLSAFAILIIVTCRANFISSHCARPDVLAGLVVLLVIVYFALLRKRNYIPQTSLWWFLFGMTMMALGWTSSIHLLTLLGPLAVWILFCFGGFKRPRFYLAAILGAITTAAILTTIYFATTSGITMFGSTNHGVQFTAIIQQTPILRPFSRSVQVANLVIRLKFLATEAPAMLALALLDLLLLLFLKMRKRPVAFFSNVDRFVFSSTGVVLLSWLYLQLASVTYTTHILAPLVFALCLLTLRLIVQLAPEKSFALPALLCAAALTVIGLQDAAVAERSGSWLSNNNRDAMAIILKQLKSDSELRGIRKPLVLVETPALHEIQKDTLVRVMTDHFVGFRTSADPIFEIMKKQNVNYVILFNSDRYPKNRYRDDEFFMAVVDSTQLVTHVTRPVFDMGSSYFDTDVPEMDTLLLFRMP